MATVLNVLDLVLGDEATDAGMLPVIIRGNQSSSVVVQLQGRISQRIRKAILTQLRAYGANNQPLCFAPLNNEASDQRVVACLHKGARADVAQLRWWYNKTFNDGEIPGIRTVACNIHSQRV